MRNLLAFLAALSLTLGGVGWYLGWFQFSSQPANDGHRNVNVDINTVKIGDDVNKGLSAAQELADKHKKETAEPPKAGDPRPTTAEAGQR